MEKRVFNKKPLDVKDSRILELSRQYQVPPKMIAYIRSAIGSKNYDRDTLIEHIEIGNDNRWKAIEEHKVSDILSLREKEDLIKYTKINIEFREDVIKFLKSIGQIQITDLIS